MGITRTAQDVMRDMRETLVLQSRETDALRERVEQLEKANRSMRAGWVSVREIIASAGQVGRFNVAGRITRMDQAAATLFVELPGDTGTSLPG